MANSIFVTPGGFSNTGTNIVFPLNVPLDYQATALATTSTDGLILENTTAATSGATVQLSPRLRWVGSAWNSSGLASELDAAAAELLPVTVAGTTTSLWRLGFSIAGGAFSFPFSITSAGVVTAADYLASSSGFNITSVGVFRSSAFGTKITMPTSDGLINFQNNANSAGIGWDVTTDAVLKLRTRAQSAYATLDVLGLRASGASGATFGPSVVTSLTVVNGIVTAVS